jgi:acyl-CoA thioester hydrolase
MPRAPNPWKSVKKNFFPFRQIVPTRWADNDQYGHANNSIYHFWSDTVINNYLMQQKVLSLSPPSSEDNNNDTDAIGICAENGFLYFSSVKYPQTLEIGLCVTHIGRISVTYRVGVFLASEEEDDDGSIKALGHFVHVFTDRRTQKPLHKLPEELHAALKKILIEEPKNQEKHH